MALCRLYFVGAQLLLLSHMVQSFILLTANMEDVKKIARKFVSESLAEKVTDFVAKATEHMFANKSEESTDNDEFKGQNLLRQRYEKPTRANKDELEERASRYKEVKEKIVRGKASTDPKERNIKTLKHDESKEYKKSITLENIIKTISYVGQAIDWDKDNNDIANEKSYSKEKSYLKEAKTQEMKPVYEALKIDNDRIKHKEPKDASEPSNNDYDQQKPDYEQPKISYEKPKIAYESPKIAYEKPKVIYEKPKIDYERPNPNNEWQKNGDRLIQNSDQQNQDDKNEKRKIKRKPKNPHRSHHQITNLKELRNPGLAETDKTKHEPMAFKPTIRSTILYHKALRLGIPVKRPVNRGHRLTSFDSKEFKPSNNQINGPKESIPFNQNTPPSLQGFNIPVSSTTKERIEFDQYDNPNYPKAEFIATSGPVALPKVPMIKPWWEKEMVAKIP